MKRPAALSFDYWFKVVGVGFCFFCIVLFLLAFIGPPFISPFDLISSKDPLAGDLFFKARLPRVLFAFVVGGALSASGVAFQSLLRNPLADPYTLGVSGGAALGGVAAMALGFSFPMVTLVAFTGALVSLLLIYRLAQVNGRLPSASLLLTGVMFNAFAFALILLINSLISFGQAHQILFFLIGSLEAVSLNEVLWVSLLVAGGLFILFFQSSHMNIVSLGEETTHSLGISAEIHRKIIFISASVIVGATVAYAGLIGFVGLFVPHFVRLIFGGDHRLTFPLSVIGGGIFLGLSDFLSHLLFWSGDLQTQLPVGVITALIGGPFFIYLMKRSL